MSVQPVAFGYICLGPGVSGATARAALARYATREGLVLGQVFVEADGSGPRVALASLVEAVGFHEVTAILVQRLDHLGPDPPGQAATRARIEREASLPVLVVEGASSLDA